MRFTITYTRTLTLEQEVEASTQEEAENIAKKRAWESCDLSNSDFDESETEFAVDGSMKERR